MQEETADTLTIEAVVTPALYLIQLCIAGYYEIDISDRIVFTGIYP
ncbi:MAG: hypothetical protein AAGJ37_17530 [Pseudomonadota bacterium]